MGVTQWELGKSLFAEPLGANTVHGGKNVLCTAVIKNEVAEKNLAISSRVLLFGS